MRIGTLPGFGGWRGVSLLATGLALLVAFGLPVGAGKICRAADATAPVTLQSLLQEMIDRAAIARTPAPAFTLKESSSHDRRKVDPADAAGWHSNDDHEQFIRTETNEGRKEWVIMDDTGPGAVTRFWTPLWDRKDKTLIRFYFDGAATPALTLNFNDLLGGRDFVKPPLAFISWNQTDLRAQLKPEYKAGRGIGGDIYLPIPFAKGCKITLDSVPFYYVINYRMYAPGTAVQTFSMTDYQAAAPVVQHVSAVLLATPALTDGGTAKDAKLAPGEELTLDLPAGGAAVRQVQVTIDPADAPQVLRSTVLQATFDDQPAIWCPLSEFFGSGARLNPVQDWCRSVTASGQLLAQWVMPYEHTGRLALKNVGAKPVTVKLAATTGAWTWDDNSMYFRAAWRCQRELKTRPMSDWNYLEMQGAGVYAGDTLTVYSPHKAWYGEGDERIYLEGEKVASHIGTGTEDYYGYAWGMPEFFNSPFISTPLRDQKSRDDWRGYTTTSRLRLLDGIPVQKSLKHDMEIWNWADTKVDYAVGLFWYARPGATHNRTPQPEEAAAPLHEGVGTFKIAGAIECETMTRTAQTPGLAMENQGAGLQDGQWSGDAHLFVRAAKVGDFVELEIPVSDDQPRKVVLYATKSWDYGIVHFTVNGAAAGDDFDAYAPKAIASGPIVLGTFTPQDHKLRLRATVAGSNPKSKGTGCFFGLDCVVLQKP